LTIFPEHFLSVGDQPALKLVENLTFPFATEFVTEGSVTAVVPNLKAFVRKPSDYAPSKAPVFYNPVMELNRDLAVIALQSFQRNEGDTLTVCEPLSGCGIRAIRFAKEIDGIEKVVANDISEEAYRFVKHNTGIKDLLNKVCVKNEDANFLLSRHAAPKKRFDCIDLDPFGSPIPYLDCALRALRRGGLLALTATDMAPLCGVHSKACLRKYGGKPLRTEYCHELATRLLAGASAKSAAKYAIGLKVLFSHSLQHYTRIYCKTNYGAKKADNCLQSIGYIHHCFACFHRTVVPGTVHCGKRTCPKCGSKMSIAGPLWIGKIIDEDFVASMEKEAETKVFRLKSKVDKLLDLTEKEANAPITYYVIDRICDKFELPVPSISKVVGELKRTGQQVCLTHFNTRGIKTDAPAKKVKEAIISCLDSKT